MYIPTSRSSQPCFYSLISHQISNQKILTRSSWLQNLNLSVSSRAKLEIKLRSNNINIIAIILFLLYAQHFTSWSFFFVCISIFLLIHYHSRMGKWVRYTAEGKNQQQQQNSQFFLSLLFLASQRNWNSCKIF